MEIHNPMYTPSKEGMKAKGYKYHSSLEAMNAAAKRNGEIKKKSALARALSKSHKRDNNIWEKRLKTNPSPWKK